MFAGEREGLGTNEASLVNHKLRVVAAYDVPRFLWLLLFGVVEYDHRHGLCFYRDGRGSI